MWHKMQVFVFSNLFVSLFSVIPFLKKNLDRRSRLLRIIWTCFTSGTEGWSGSGALCSVHTSSRYFKLTSIFFTNRTIRDYTNRFDFFFTTPKLPLLKTLLTNKTKNSLRIFQEIIDVVVLIFLNFFVNKK